MAKNLIKSWFPAYDSVRGHRGLRMLGPRLRAPDLWHMNRRSVAGAFAVGLFVAFLPIPLQMVLAAAIAVWARVNLPISVLLVWVSNPLTMPAIFYTAYTIGRWILDVPPRSFRVEMTLEWFTSDLLTIWKPLVAGSLVLSVVAGISGYLIIRVLWWISVVERLRLKRVRMHHKLLQSQKNPYRDPPKVEDPPPSDRPPPY
jgi:uncharacterized protein (DUF2062 family)